MALLSALFRGDLKLEAAAALNSAHIPPASRGDHVIKIQTALNMLENAGLGTDGVYGAKTASAVLAYKRKRQIINTAYQTQPDNIVGKLTMESLDREVYAKERIPPPAPPKPGPKPGPGPHPNLSFSLTDPSIYVTVEGPITTTTNKGLKVIDPASFPGKGLLKWKVLGEVGGKTAILKIEKKGSVFWMIAFVPTGTTVSHILHIFFHPTPVQVAPDKPGGKPVVHVIADDNSYDRFGTDWRRLGTNYLTIIAPQLAAARKIPLLLPLMRNSASLRSTAVNDVFADRPLDTLFEILTVVSQKMIVPTSDDPVLPLAIDSVAIGTSSFSSGVSYHASFLERVKNFGNYLEAIDLDSSFIRSAHQDIAQYKPGPQIKRHGQSTKLPNSPIFWQFPPSRWDGAGPDAPTGLEKFPTPPDSRTVHHQIAFRTFFGAMEKSLLKP